MLTNYQLLVLALEKCLLRSIVLYRIVNINFAKQNSTRLQLKPKTMFPQNLFLILFVKLSSQNQIQDLAKSIDRLVEQQNLGKFRQNLREWSKHARRLRDMKRFRIIKVKKYFLQFTSRANFYSQHAFLKLSFDKTPNRFFLIIRPGKRKFFETDVFESEKFI